VLVAVDDATGQVGAPKVDSGIARALQLRHLYLQSAINVTETSKWP
jgi:hypothetical protein